MAPGGHFGGGHFGSPHEAMMRHAGLSPIGSPMSRYSPSHDSLGGRHSSTEEPKSPLAPTLIMQVRNLVNIKSLKRFFFS